MKKRWGIVIVVVVVVAAFVGWIVWKVGSVAGDHALAGTYATAEAAVNGYLKQHTHSYAIRDVKGPILMDYENGQGKGEYQMTVNCDCKWADGMDTKGTVFFYVDHVKDGWQVVSAGSGP
jgi:hypothetical protein